MEEKMNWNKKSNQKRKPTGEKHKAKIICVECGKRINKKGLLRHKFDNHIPNNKIPWELWKQTIIKHAITPSKINTYSSVGKKRAYWNK